jgi:zinc protease
MKNWFALYAIALCCCVGWGRLAAQEDFRAQAPKPGPAPKIELGKYERFKLKNGLEVIVVENRKLPRVSFQMFVDVPAHQEGELAGRAEMAGELLTKGAGKRSKAEIDEAVDFIGASLSSSAQGIFASGLSRYKEEILELLADALLRPAFPLDEFEKLKTQTLSALAAAKDDPASIAANAAQATRFGAGHPYGALTTEKTVEAITVEHCREYYHTYFKPNIAYFIAIGDINAREARKLAQQHFGAWKQGEVKKTTFAPPAPPPATMAYLVDRPGSVQSVIDITYPVVIRPGDPEAVAATLANNILGEGSSGRLFVNIREDKGYTYGAYSRLNPDKEVGYFSAGASVRNEVTDSAIVEFLAEMRRMRDEPVGDDELRRAKNERLGAFARSLERPQTLANFALNVARFNLPENYYATFPERLGALTARDIQQAARKFILPERSHIVVVGDKSQVADKLTRFSAGSELRYLDRYGRPVQAPVAAPSGIDAAQVIQRYLEAIGGPDKLRSIEDVALTLESSGAAMGLEMKMLQKAPNKLAVSISAGGMVLQEQKFDGQQGVVVEMGQRSLVQGKDLEELRAQALIFPELHYEELNYQLRLEGLENLDGNNAYRVEVIRPDGARSTSYFDAESGLKLREITVDAEQGLTITRDYADYQNAGGVRWPHTISISGLAPIPLNFKVNAIEINQGLDDGPFSIN